MTCPVQLAGQPILLRCTPVSQAALGMSLGYFVLDIALMLKHYPWVSSGLVTCYLTGSLDQDTTARLACAPMEACRACLWRGCTTPLQP